MIAAMDIRDQVRTDVLDYQQLVSCLRGYSKPRDRITALLADGSLIRVRPSVTQARQEIERFVGDKLSLTLWSTEFFLEIVDRIETG
jgi:hypothetical protein